MIDKLPEIQIHSCAKINEKLNEVIDWINDVSALRVTDKQVTANLPNIDAGELAFLSKENTELKDEIDRLETELIRTRKALDVAVDALKRLEKELYFNNAKQTGHIADSVMSIPSITLEQITAE